MRAAFRAVDSGYQVAVLAPTTILADQHLETFQRRFEGVRGDDRADLAPAHRQGPEGAAASASRRARSTSSIGTHRLLSKDIELRPPRPADRRRGAALRRGAEGAPEAAQEETSTCSPMSATPLPRTLQLSLAGVRDMSVIETPPKDRMAVETAVLPYSDELVREAIEFELERGGAGLLRLQPRRVDRASARRSCARSCPGCASPSATVSSTSASSTRRMHAFTAREHDLLLATTIIENGIDIPTVNTMIVHRADRFGLAQLYQLRGRVGRSRELGYCYLLVPGDRVALRGRAAAARGAARVHRARRRLPHRGARPRDPRRRQPARRRAERPHRRAGDRDLPEDARGDGARAQGRSGRGGALDRARPAGADVDPAGATSPTRTCAWRSTASSPPPSSRARSCWPSSPTASAARRRRSRRCSTSRR